VSRYGSSKSGNIGSVGGTAHHQALEYYDTVTLKRVLELVAVDYVTLNFSLPAWTNDVPPPESLPETPSGIQCFEDGCPELVRAINSIFVQLITTYIIEAACART
jgi:hypothetical protein